MFTTPKTMKLKEVFNKDYLHYIVTHQKEFENKLRNKCFDNNYDPFKIPSWYLKCSSNGVIDVKYKKVSHKDMGRLFAKGNPSMQGISREIRHTIAKEYYDDVDVVNCHPVILKYLCEKHDIDHDYLDVYIKDRETVIQNSIDANAGSKILIDRDFMKSCILSLINNGSGKYSVVNKKTKWLRKFKKEMDLIRSKLEDNYGDLFEAMEKKNKKEKKKYNNYQGSAVNLLFCEYENTMLMHMFDFFKNEKIVSDTAVLCFDGIMIPKNKRNKNLVNDCEKFISNKMGFNINLKIKPMDCGFDMSECKVENYDDSKTSEMKNIIKKIIKENDITDNTLGRLFIVAVKDNLKTVNSEGDGYLYCGKKKLWEEKVASDIRVEMCNPENGLLPTVKHYLHSLFIEHANSEKNEAVDIEEKIKLCKRIERNFQSNGKIKDIYAIARTKLMDVKFQDVVNRQHHLFPMKNGLVINLKNAKIRQRRKEDLFTFECPVNYIPHSKWTKQDKKTRAKFINQIFCEDETLIEYMHIKLGSYLCGEITREYDIGHGAGQNAKSTLVNSVDVIMGGFVHYIGRSAIFVDPRATKRSQGSNHTSHLIPLQGARLVICQESEENDEINGEMVKKIASGDIIEGIREVYGRKTGIIKPFCKLLICTNHIPKVQAMDGAVIDRTNMIPFKARFLDKERMKLEKLSGRFNEKENKYYAADKSLAKKYKDEGREIDILFSWMVEGCVKFYALDGESIPQPDIVKYYKQDKMDEADMIKQFLDGMCEIMTRNDWKKWEEENKGKNKGRKQKRDALKKKFRISRPEFYNEFSYWAKENDCHAGYTKPRFYKEISMKVGEITSNGKKYFKNVRVIYGG